MAFIQSYYEEDEDEEEEEKSSVKSEGNLEKFKRILLRFYGRMGNSMFYGVTSFAKGEVTSESDGKENEEEIKTYIFFHFIAYFRNIRTVDCRKVYHLWVHGICSHCSHGMFEVKNTNDYFICLLNGFLFSGLHSKFSCCFGSKRKSCFV